MSTFGIPTFGDASFSSGSSGAGAGTGGTTGGTGGTTGGSGGGSNPPTINSFTSSSSTSTPGAPVTLNFEVSAGSTVSITPDVGTVLASPVTVAPTTTTTFTLTASSPGGFSTASLTVTIGGASPENVRYHQIRRNDRLGSGKLLQMASGEGTVDGYPVLYDAFGDVIGRAPRGNTTVVQLADQTGGFTLNNLLAFDANGNAKDSGVAGSGLVTAGAFGSPYEQIPVGAKDGVNVNFFLDYIPATPPTGTPAVVPFWLYRNGLGQSPYTPEYTLAPGSNHLVMLTAPDAQDEFWCVYFRGATAAPVSPVVSAVVAVVYTYTPSPTADGFVKLQSGTALPILFDNSARVNRAFTVHFSPLPAGFGSGGYTVSLELYHSLFLNGTDVLHVSDVYADVTHADTSVTRIRPTAQAYEGNLSLFDPAVSWLHVPTATGDGTNVIYSYTHDGSSPSPDSSYIGKLITISGFSTLGFNIPQGTRRVAAVDTSAHTITVVNPTVGTETIPTPSGSWNGFIYTNTYDGTVTSPELSVDGDPATYATLTRFHYYPGHSGGGILYTF